MITNNRTLTAVTFCGAVLAVSLVSQPGHAGIALNGIALNGLRINGANLNGTGVQGTSINGRYVNGLRQLGTAANPAAPTETSGKRVLAIELSPAAD
jgi:hypothetical protein